MCLSTVYEENAGQRTKLCEFVSSVQAALDIVDTLQENIFRRIAGIVDRTVGKRLTPTGTAPIFVGTVVVMLIVHFVAQHFPHVDKP